LTWRPSPRRRARGGRANSSLDDAGSAGDCRCRCLAVAGYSTHRTCTACSLRKLRELSSRPSSSRATERRGHHAERARAHLLCRYVPNLNSHRVRVFVALSAVARVTDLARVVRRFFFSSLVSKFEREGTFHAFTASARAGTDASRVARVRRGSGPCPRRGARRRAALSFSIRMVTNSFLLCKNTAVLYATVVELCRLCRQRSPLKSY